MIIKKREEKEEEDFSSDAHGGKAAMIRDERIYSLNPGSFNSLNNSLVIQYSNVGAQLTVTGSGLTRSLRNAFHD